MICSQAWALQMKFAVLHYIVQIIFVVIVKERVFIVRGENAPKMRWIVTCWASCVVIQVGVRFFIYVAIRNNSFEKKK
jgi:hypothetical protein